MNKHVILLVAAAVLAPSPLRGQEEKPGIAEGAAVFADNCSRCHNARSGTERVDAAWVPIVAHMRARANLTKREAQAVLVFLQGTNLPENTAAQTPAAGFAEARMVVPRSLREALLALVRKAPATGGPARPHLR